MARVSVPPAPTEPRTDALEAARVLSPEMRRDFCVVVPAYNEVEMVPVGCAVFPAFLVMMLITPPSDDPQVEEAGPLMTSMRFMISTGPW